MPCRPSHIPSGASRFVLPGIHPGLIERGNIDLFRRPFAPNRGAISTVDSTDVEEDGLTVVISQVLPLTPAKKGTVVPYARAVREYRSSGLHLGKFRNWHDGERYSRKLHEQQARIYCLLGGRG